MPTVADALRLHAPRYLETWGDRIPWPQRQVLRALVRCRTGELGSTLYECTGCGHRHWVGRSCGNRHCATCQHEKTQEWLARQAERLLPVHYFLVTFTIPEELRSVLRAHPRAGYQALFQAGSDTLRALLTNPRWLGTSQVGFFGVLHTWGRDPTVYHPHVHFVVPGGGLSEDLSQWISTPANFLFPESCASPIFRAKMRDALLAADAASTVDPTVWQKRWEVNVQPVGDGRAVLKYLAPYVFRVAISDQRIVAVDEQSVTYRYTPSGTDRSKTKTVSGQEFVRGFLQHVLPKGFQKVRHYGWQGAHAKTRLDTVKWLVWLFLGWTYWLGSGHAPPDIRVDQPSPKCQHCGERFNVIYHCRVDKATLPQHVLNYLDSG